MMTAEMTPATPAIDPALLDTERTDRPATVAFIAGAWDAARAARRRAEALILPSVPARRAAGEDSPDDDCCYFSGCRHCGGSGTRNRR